jgi:hypothetical protein
MSLTPVRPHTIVPFAVTAVSLLFRFAAPVSSALVWSGRARPHRAIRVPRAHSPSPPTPAWALLIALA